MNIFCTDIVGLSAAAISFIVRIARIWDAVNDPMMGQIADRTNTRWGRFRPYLMFAHPVLAVFNILIFTVFPATLAIVSLIPIWFYMLDDKKVSEIRADPDAGKHAWDK